MNTNKYEVVGNVLWIITKKGEVIRADVKDFGVLSKHCWCISKTGYPVARIKGKTTKLHRFLLNLTDPKVVVDHINHDPLDNRRENMRVCTQKENSRNKGGNIVRGIRHKGRGYDVRIMLDRKEHYVGRFYSLEEAIKARHEAEDKYHGEFAFHRSIER